MPTTLNKFYSVFLFTIALFSAPYTLEAKESEASGDLKTEIKAIYKEVEKQRGEMQHRFDTETEHSIKKEKEYLWEEFVAKKLSVYDNWK